MADLPPEPPCCEICRQTDPEFCSDEHSADAVALARALGRAIWGDDPCPPENLASHVEDAVAIIASGARIPFGQTEWTVEMWTAEMIEEAGLDDDRDCNLMTICDEFVFGIDPSAEGFDPPRTLSDLVLRRV